MSSIQGLPGKKRGDARVAPRRSRGLGRGDNRGQLGRDVAEHVVDLGADALDRQNADDGDQADEHAVFDQRRAFIVLGKTSNQFTRLKKILYGLKL
jgi:hypothetical protein